MLLGLICYLFRAERCRCGEARDVTVRGRRWVCRVCGRRAP